ncbi:L-isoaspartyl protein carboxyl methyltransferase protein (plasmid) [Sinorhizobium fredii NGR234]|uniref:Protein-L-isoaspartate O-methyltransferase n=1 Tax=Sinorhizobium fredii (strain NBRC 101917 / NGR234) TaxID=394 RepID=Q6W168_SINFN|nr:protein-L-isoaspartate(D-aspartate) O-methyltransferase [Sinorhizobium fredii]AAQ87500.1 Protein-L-isoaspartate O-methyltransferase [Sinorhizobium fredii NGR234]ACP22035.1 L-isoaspartyl protein carboxyl methyltransferase protein [Sinorhizobium fredii NGR234]
MLDYAHARHQMAERQLVRRGITDARVLAAMRAVPREAFVEDGFQEFAYEDSALPIAAGQTISQPYIVARMAEAAEIEPDDSVLEVGAGSGYAAAVLSHLAERVFAIERHRTLAETASARLLKLRRSNVDVRASDGTKGWPERAPFDAILVAAGGPVVPRALKEQLEIGGRLIIPVGRQEQAQRLLRITRTAANRYEEEDLGGVLFVPLIGEGGWSESSEPDAHARRRVPDLVAEAADDLPLVTDPGFADPFERFARHRIVLLGEATHGTSEFYQARAVITQRLIERHGFAIVAVEADWPDAAAVNAVVRTREAASGEPPFQRFPAWMWRNAEFAAFVSWLKTHNGTQSTQRQAGFYGLDLYNMRGSIAAVLSYLDESDREAATVARERYGCLTPWQNEPGTYGRAVLTSGYRRCEDAVIRQCQELLARALDTAGDDAVFDAAQNARLIATAEKYYRIMYYGGADAWNLRDRHMFETLDHLLERADPTSKAIVWAHNSHIGDARHTDMGKLRGELNLGQLCREKYGDEVALVGFGTHRGTVAAASEWDGQMEIKAVRPSLEETVERCCHLSGKERFLLDFVRKPDVAQSLSSERLERFIGVIYRPESELLSHYARAELSKQFDAYVWFDETRAVSPLPVTAGSGHVPDTFPFGL